LDIIKILAIALITCIATIIVKQVKPDFANLVTLAGGIVVLLMLVDYINQVFDVLKLLVDKTNLSPGLFSIVLKIIGIGYLTEFTANICNDSGSSSLANKVLFAGKIVILVMSLPILINIIEIIMGILP
jgi:stage III sporulation protein AD